MDSRNIESRLHAAGVEPETIKRVMAIDDQTVMTYILWHEGWTHEEIGRALGITKYHVGVLIHNNRIDVRSVYDTHPRAGEMHQLREAGATPTEIANELHVPLERVRDVLKGMGSFKPSINAETVGCLPEWDNWRRENPVKTGIKGVVGDSNQSQLTYFIKHCVNVLMEGEGVYAHWPGDSHKESDREKGRHNGRLILKEDRPGCAVSRYLHQAFHQFCGVVGETPNAFLRNYILYRSGWRSEWEVYSPPPVC